MDISNKVYGWTVLILVPPNPVVDRMLSRIHGAPDRVQNQRRVNKRFREVNFGN
jgi:hypothetical protein